MNRTQKKENDIVIFLKKNIIILIFGLAIFLIGCIVIFKLLNPKKETIYVQVKVSQGLWWASTLKPSIWLADSLQKGDTELNFSQKPVVEIIEVRKYPLNLTNTTSEQYEVLLTVKMQVSKNETTHKYTFKRSNITIGAPIEYEFQNTSVTGTVMQVSENPITNTYEDKIVVLEKDLAQEWEYDAITIGDTYFDGEDIVLEVLDKNITDRYSAIYTLGGYNPVFSGTRVNIRTTVKMKLKKKDKNYIFRDELPIVKGKRINLNFDQAVLSDFVVSSLE